MRVFLCNYLCGFLGLFAAALIWTDSAAKSVSHEELRDWADPRAQGAVGQSYATTSAGTFLVSGHKIFLFEDVLLPDEIVDSLTNLVSGALWKEGYLLSHELFLDQLWAFLAKPVQLILRGTSQMWLLWRTYQSLVKSALPIVSLLRSYYRVSHSPRYEGNLPILINDAELAFRFFLHVRFPEEEKQPATVVIDRIPDMAGIPRLVRQYAHQNPWNRVLDEMDRNEITRLEFSGSRDGDIQIRFRDVKQHWVEQKITAVANSEYHPVPWLFEMIRNRIDRNDLKLHSSLLSQDVLALVAAMLECHQEASETPNLGAWCEWGRIEPGGGGEIFTTHKHTTPKQIWEERNHTSGRILSLTGCNYSNHPLCWENSLVWLTGSKIYPWPILILYSRFSSFKERNNWILMEDEPQIWYGVSFFQIRVPEALTRTLLGLVNTVGQVAVNRLVTSLHHKWWKNGFASKKVEIVTKSTAVKEGAKDAVICPVCYGYYQKKTMVDLGCSSAKVPKTLPRIHTLADVSEAPEHLTCVSCTLGVLKASVAKACSDCGHYHSSSIMGEYHGDGRRPFCSYCREPYDWRRGGNLKSYLKNDDAPKHPLSLWQRLRWISDDLGVDSPKKQP